MYVSTLPLPAPALLLRSATQLLIFAGLPYRYGQLR
jgi:hypothetical protein